jgi:hypothetical protein
MGHRVEQEVNVSKACDEDAACLVSGEVRRIPVLLMARMVAHAATEIGFQLFSQFHEFIPQTF